MSDPNAAPYDSSVEPEGLLDLAWADDDCRPEEDVPDPAGLLSEPDLVVIAYGKPIPQGSKTRGKFGMWDDNAKVLHPWRATVKTAAGIARGELPTIEGPAQVEAVFTMPRPKDHYGTGRNAEVLKASAPAWPIGRGTGDVDKMSRALLDSLADAGVFTNDVQVVSLVGLKVYPNGPHRDALDRPGCVARIRALT